MQSEERRRGVRGPVREKDAAVTSLQSTVVHVRHESTCDELVMIQCTSRKTRSHFYHLVREHLVTHIIYS